MMRVLAVGLAVGGSVLGLNLLSSPALAIVPGQTAEFPQTGAWSGSNWDWDNAHVFHWNSFWNGNQYTGSAVAVAPHYLLTAGHVDGKPSDYAVINGQQYHAVASYVPPNDPGQSGPPDLRLIQVDKPLPGYHSIFTGTPTKGQELFLIGYGQTGTYSGGSTSWAAGTEGIGRWGTNLIGSSSIQRLPSGGRSSLTFRMTSYDDADTPYEAFAGNGDSGGGAFVKVGDEWQLAGIMVNSGSTITYAVSLPHYSDWILETAAIPEPTGVAALSTLGALALRRRRAVASS